MNAGSLTLLLLPLETIPTGLPCSFIFWTIEGHMNHMTTWRPDQSVSQLSLSTSLLLESSNEAGYALLMAADTRSVAILQSSDGMSFRSFCLVDYLRTPVYALDLLLLTLMFSFHVLSF